MAGIKVVLVEDDWIISKELSYSLADFGFEVLATFDTGEEAVKQIPVLAPDIVLIDIDLSGEMTGIDVGEKLKHQFNIPFIFLTALADPATIDKAKLVDPYAYLVKPVNPDSLYSTIELTLHQALRQKPEVPAAIPFKENLSMDDGIFIKQNKRMEKVMLHDILFVEAHDIYAMVHTADSKNLLNSSLKVIEEKFPASKFIRVHRSYIVNLDHVSAIEENDILIQEIRIPIGKTHRENLMSRISLL